MKKVLLTFVFTAFIAFSTASCGNTSSVSNSGQKPEIKKDVKPVADDEIAIIEMENSAAFGVIKIELYSNIAPKMVARFKKLANEGFYDGVSFHRVNDTVIQAGDPNSKDDDPTNDGIGSSDKENIPAEFSGVEYDAGIVGAARRPGDVNSQNSQFFITLKRAQGFDENYTLFGKVIEGMSYARTIAGVRRDERERPFENVVIKSIKIVKKE